MLSFLVFLWSDGHALLVFVFVHLDERRGQFIPGPVDGADRIWAELLLLALWDYAGIMRFHFIWGWIYSSPGQGFRWIREGGRGKVQRSDSRVSNNVGEETQWKARITLEAEGKLDHSHPPTSLFVCLSWVGRSVACLPAWPDSCE